MIKTLKKSSNTIILISFIALSAYALLLPVSVRAVPADPWGNQVNSIENEIGLGTEDPRIIAAQIINVILGFLGIIAVVIILLGGFKWMTAVGNEDKVGEAKNLMFAGFTGLVIILASWGLAKFIINELMAATTNG